MAFRLPWGRRYHNSSPLQILWVLSIHRGIKPALQQGFHRTNSLWGQEVSAEEES